MIRFIGDVHGKYNRYRELIRNVPRSIQVGDMGVGFIGEISGRLLQNPPYDAMVQGDHRFIRGNHDNPAVCAKHSQWIPDGTIEGNMMFVGGAVSIDRQYRIEGRSWWPDEELSYPALDVITGKYLSVKPEVMVTHECPEEVAQEILQRLSIPGVKLDPQFASRTRQAFQAMWSAHSPKLWVFGHWHVPFDHVLRGTRFVCLPELAVLDIDPTSLDQEEKIAS